MYIIHSYLLSHKHEQLFKIHNFQGQKHFWAKCAQIGYEKKIHQFKSFCLLNYQC
jgi:hypothetical protein